MRPLLSVFIVSALVFTLDSCSDENGDSFAGKCEKACSVDPSSPCANKEAECNSTCTSLANQAASNVKYMAGCAECIIDSFNYSINPNPPCSATSSDLSCCWGVQHAAPEDDTCLSKCVEPDGGVGY